jgi:hypothetical protein
MAKQRGKPDLVKPIQLSADDNSHYAKAFKIAWKIEDARDKLSRATSSAARNLHRKTVREETPKLDELIARDRSMTRALAEFLRRHNPQLDAEAEMIKWLRGEGAELGTYTEFVRWCEDRRIELDRLEERRPLRAAEVRRIAALDELADLDERTIRKRFQSQYAAHGKRGRPKKATETKV